MSQSYKILPIDCLQRGRFQPRVNFEPTTLNELAHSIKTQGLLEPLIVREVAPSRYEIIAGERRFRAASLAGLTDIACLVGSYNDAEAASLTLVENLQREELNLIEEAEGYRRLIDEFHYSQQDVARLVSKSRSHIANILRLLQLTPAVQTLVRDAVLSFGHARVLVGMSAELQNALAKHTLTRSWSVRTLEEKAKAIKTKKTPLMPDSQLDTQFLEGKLAEYIGSPVQIIEEADNSGWLKVKFFNNDTLEGILERIGLRYDE